MGSSTKRKIVVRSQREITKGKGSKGDWTMYSVEAETPDGKVIVEQLKTFEELPRDREIEVEVEEQVHERYGISYLLRGGGGKGSRTKDLEGRVAALEGRMDAAGL